MSYEAGQPVTTTIGNGVLLGRFTSYGGHARWRVRMDNGMSLDVSEASILSAQPVPQYEVGQRVRLVSGRSGPVVEVLGDDRYRVELPRVHEDQEQSTSVHAVQITRAL